MGRWCRGPVDDVVALAMHNQTERPTLNQQALQLRPVLRRTLTLGFYSAHLSRWLVHFPGTSMRVQWLEHFKVDPFRAMWAAESFLGLPHHDYRQQVTPAGRDGSRAEQRGGWRGGAVLDGGERAADARGGSPLLLGMGAQWGWGSAARR